MGGYLFCGQLGISSISEGMIVELNCKVTQSTYWKCKSAEAIANSSFSPCFRFLCILLSPHSFCFTFLPKYKEREGREGVTQEELQKHVVEIPKGLLQSQIISSIISNQATRTHIVIILCTFFDSHPSSTDISLQINSILGKNFVTSYFSLSNSVNYANSCRLFFPINVKPMMSLQETPAFLRSKGPAWSINMFRVLTRNFY